MAVKLTIRLDNKSVTAKIAHLERATADLTPLMIDIGNFLEGSTKDRLMQSNTSPGGVPWPQSMRAKEDGGKTLVDSRRLLGSIVNVPGAKSVEIGSNLVYAGIHQTGGDIVPKNGKALAFALPNGEFVTVGKVTIPARPYLGVSADDVATIDELVEGHLDLAGVQ